MKEKAVQIILDNMRDSEDPIVGSVFEKGVNAPFEDFCVFMLSAYKNVTIEKHNENGKNLYLFYDGPGATDHIGTYIPYKNHGCFGGSRVGSRNEFRKPGDPVVSNPFDINSVKW
jgi:hypothetical protein